MAPGTRAMADVAVHEDAVPDCGSSLPTEDSAASNNELGVLAERSSNELQKKAQLDSSWEVVPPPMDQLVADLKGFSINDNPLKENTENTLHDKTQGSQAKASLEPGTSTALGTVHVQDERTCVAPASPKGASQDPPEPHSLVLAAETLDSPRAQVAKHQAATPIGESPASKVEATAKEGSRMAASEISGKLHTRTGPSTQHAGFSRVPQERRTLSATEESDESYVEIITHQKTATPLPRIEDSFEALDRFEEQVEAVTAAARLSRVLSPDAVKGSSQHGGEVRGATPSARQSAAGSKKPISKQGSVRRNTTEVARTGAVRKSVVPASPTANDNGTVKPPAKKPVSRPASLAPPKPLVKSSRQSVVPTFELPGEAVARKLREQKEARLSLQVNAVPQAASTPRRMCSTKSSRSPPTVPTFELPGEAISRRKREAHAAKLKAQEEEERKRREFKARPIRASLGPSTLVRETITSRARTSKPFQGDVQTSQLLDANSSNLGKRHSVTPSQFSRPSLSSTTSSAGPPSRGRDTTVGSPSATQISRAASSSTGSISGKRSTISAEEVQQQKLRGREILRRDRLFAEEREREKQAREAAAKLARQEAAERSRLLSREWAEKQRQKKLVASTGASPARSTDVVVG